MERRAQASARSDGAARDADPPRLFDLELRAPLLVASFATPRRVLSWAVARPGFQLADRVAWLEVRNADLPVGVDPAALLAGALARGGVDDAVAMMTSRHVDRFRRAGARLPGALADCVATVGLSNAARVARPATESGGTGTLGTINLLAAVSEPLSDVGLIEALSIATEARTAAVIDAGWRLAEGVATGTGTDCVAVAVPEGGAVTYAGLHTAVGQAIGAAVYEATLAATLDWIAERGGC